MTLKDAMIVIMGEPQTMVGYVLLDTLIFTIEVLLYFVILFGIPYTIWYAVTHRR